MGSKTANVAVVLFLIAQACDGVLTYIGVSLYGPAIDGNPVLGLLMGTMGQGLALATARLTAGAFGIALHLFAVHKVVAALVGFYVIAAFLPWIDILFIS